MKLFNMIQCYLETAILIVAIVVTIVLGIKATKPRPITMYQAYKWSSEHRSFHLDQRAYMADSLIFLACKGNIEAYNRLMKDDVFREDILPYSILMVNKYKYYPACYDVYRALYYPFQSLDSLGPEGRRLALQYLHIGARHGDQKSAEALKAMSQGHARPE